MESTAAALRTKDSSELTWEYVATTLIDDYNARQETIGTNVNSGAANGRPRRQKYRNKKTESFNDQEMYASNQHESDHDCEIEKTVKAFSAVLKSSIHGKSSVTYDLCGKKGHSKGKYFMNPENPDNKLTPKMRAVRNSGNPKKNKHIVNKYRRKWNN